MHTFYLPTDQWPQTDGASCLLDGQEARHLSKVLRIKSGETVRLLDGAGHTGEFRVNVVGKNNVELGRLSVQEHPRNTQRCFLAAAYTKATRRSWLLEKAVELEAGGIWFWQAEYSQIKVPDGGKESWQEQLVAGAKQCLNPWLPELDTVQNGAVGLIAKSTNFAGKYLLWEDEDTGNMLSFEDISPKQAPAGNGDMLFIMGPEGGLSKNEVNLFKQAGFKSVSLGRRVLRWETAALLCLGLTYWARELNR
ncbi:16S rRNA (uracil(1498)-N(3))-methyltransferase [Desulfovibrio sp. OttesenSCG-928-C06]|nr:16S rRNA (uracil(1498)-N(3))-methyltransferase [Desulfovibrio sp. OttesenSCG-928-C06]